MDRFLARGDLRPSEFSLAPAAESSPKLPKALFAVPVALVDAILSRMPAPDVPLRNIMGPGFVLREVMMPAGTLAVARRYTAPHACICAHGEITVWGDGVDPVVIAAGHSYFEPLPGVQRIGYCHADTIWITVFANPDNLEDPEAALDAVTEVPPLPEAYIGKGLPELLSLVRPDVRAMITGGR